MAIRRPSSKKNKSKSKYKKKPKKAPFLLRLLKGTFVLAIWLFILGGVVIAWFAAELPQITADVEFERKRAITYLAYDGTELATIGELKGKTIGVHELPDHLVHALLSVEDRRYYEHYGIDPRGIARAAVANIRAGAVVQGGSTITQQLAKNLFLTQERTLTRKIQEAILALWLESQLTKDEILTAYFNRVYFGSGAYGIQAAAELYFDKDARNLSLSESALLVGLLKAPSRLSPLNNPDLAQERQAVVLQAMNVSGYDAANPDALVFASAEVKDQRQIRYFTDWLQTRINNKIGAVEDDLIIKTTLHPGLQLRAQDSLSNVIDTYGEEVLITQGAILILQNNGAVRSMIGGRNYGASQFNRATQALRPPGSAFKPVVYLTALTRGWAPHDTIMDRPIRSGEYRPENFGQDYRGEVTLTQALTHSLNTATVRLAQDTGIGYIIGAARKLGFESDLDRNLSLALGSSGMTLMELVSAYTTFPNLGRRPEPFAILEIRDTEGNLYYEHAQNKPAHTYQLFPKAEVRTLNDMLESVVNHGTGRAAQIGRAAAGKTGTSQDYRDAWFIGFTSDYTAGIWLGNDDNSPMKGVTGGKYPAQMWGSLMRNAPAPPSDPDRQNGHEGFSDFISRILSGDGEAENSEQHHRQQKYNQ